MPTTRTAPGAVLLALGTALLVGCRAAPERDRTVERLLADQAYAEAYRVASERVEADPDDQEAAALRERARVAYWLDRGRGLVLEGRVAEGLEVFRALEADGAAPDQVAQWIEKSLRMLAEARRGDAWRAELAGDYDGAAAFYREAVALWPQDAFAADGLERIETLAAWRREQGEAYYKDGIRDLRNLRMAEALRSFRAAIDDLQGDADAERRAQEVLRMQAEERVRLAEQLAEDGLHHAAAAELRHAKILVDDLPGIEERIAAADLEVDVLEGMGEAERMLRRGDVDEAIAKLEELAATTRRQGATVLLALDAAKEARLESLYVRGLDLERDFHFEEAVAAYDFLLSEAGGFYADAISRRRTLASYVDLAAELYAEFEAAATDAQRLDVLRKIELFWPTYRDVPERLAELSAGAGTAAPDGAR